MGVSVGEKNKGSGIYYLFIRHESLPKGRLTRRVPGSGSEAEELAYELKKKLDARITLKEPLFQDDQQPLLPTLSEYFENWKKGTLKSLAEKTQRGYIDHFEKYIKPTLGSKRLNDVKRSDVKRFIANLKLIRIGKTKLRPLAKDSVKQIVATLSRLFTEAIDDELVSINPASRQGKTYSELGSMHNINAFDEEGARSFQEFASENAPYYFPIFAGMLHAGLRVGEAIGLLWKDVDFNRKVLNIRRQGKEGSKTKTRKTRQVEISTSLFDILRDLQKARAKEWKNVPEHVFCSSTGSALDRDNLRRKFDQLLKNAKLERRRIHDLRHSFATIHLQSGSPLQWVSKQLGHSKITMTCDVYYHYLPDTYKGDHSNTIPGIATPATRNVIAFKG